MKKLSASIILALSLTGCSVPVQEPVAVAPTQTATTYEVKASEDARVTFPRGVAPVKASKPVPEPVKTVEVIPETVVIPEPVAPVQETIPEPVPTVEAPVSVPEAPKVPVQPKPVPVAPKPVAVAPVSNWATQALASAGITGVEVTLGPTQGLCGVPSGGCGYVGARKIVISPDLGPDARGMHVLWHEVAHAVHGVTDECEAERYAHSMTGNPALMSYPSCFGK